MIGQWLQNQRQAYRKDKETFDKEINKILSEEDLKWHTPNDPDEKLKKAREAAEYFNENGKWPSNKDKTIKFSDGSACIGMWVSDRRKEHKENKVDPHIVDILSTADRNWHTGKDAFGNVKKAHEAAKHFKKNLKWTPASDNVTMFSDKTLLIGVWLSRQRSAYKENRVDPQVSDILSAADPNWHTPNDPMDKIHKAQEIVALYRQNNNKWPQTSNKTIKFNDGSALIGQWLQNQRQAYKKDKLEEEVNEILSKADPNWHTANDPDDKLNKAREAAKHFKKNGKWPSCMDKTIKFNDGSALIGQWLQNQRQAYKKDKLEEEVNKILSKADPNWHTANDKVNKAQEAAAYYKQNNKWPSNNDKTKFKDGSALIGQWLQNQRQAYKNNKLDKEIKDILSAVDANWHTPNDPDDKINKAREAVDFHKKNNKWPVKRDKIKFSDGSAYVGIWLQTQREKYKENKVEQEINRILSEADPNWHTPPRGNTKHKPPPPPPPPPKEPTAEEIHEDLSKVEHDHDSSRKAIRKYTPSQLTMHLKNIKREKVASVNDKGYVERNPGFKESLNGIFSKNVVSNEQQEGCVVVLDHTNFNTTSTLVGDGVNLEDIIVPNLDNAIEMQNNEEYGSCVNPMDLVDYIRSEETSIRAMYADLCGTVSEAERVIDALVETGRLADGGLLMITICERSKVDDALSGGREQISDLQEKLQDLGVYKRLSGVDYGAGACMATYMWKLNKRS